MTRPIDAEERAWALMCLAHGDTLAEVAEWSDRKIAEWELVLGRLAKITPLECQRLALHADGMTQDEIGRREGKTRGAIWWCFNRLRGLGLPIPYRESGDRTPEGVREAIIRLADDKVPYREIAARLGVGQNTVAKFAGPSRRDPGEGSIGRRFA